MDTLKAKAHKSREDARAKCQEQLKALNTKRLEGQKKLEVIKAATGAETDILGKHSRILCMRSKRISNDSAQVWRYHRAFASGT